VQHYSLKRRSVGRARPARHGVQAPEPAAQAPAAPDAPASSVCGTGAAYEPGCDVGHDGVIDVNDVQRVATKWGQTGVYAVDDYWLLTGNSDTVSSTHFLGTIDGRPLHRSPGIGGKSHHTTCSPSESFMSGGLPS
jgi:hypothetical protein